jgi:hypothetical protein
MGGRYNMFLKNSKFEEMPKTIQNSDSFYGNSQKRNSKIV